jgi:hypothetical protein
MAQIEKCVRKKGMSVGNRHALEISIYYFPFSIDTVQDCV